MAKVSSAAGYQQLQRGGNYTADQINRGADRLAQTAATNRSMNESKQARTDKRIDEALSGIAVDTDALLAKATGFKNRDDLARDYAMSATKRSEEYAEKAREAALKQDWRSMNIYKGRINRIKGDFKNTVNDEKILGEVFKGYQTKFASGEIDDEEWLDFGEAVENFNYEIILDDNDNKVIRAIVLDEDGNPELDDSGKPKVIEKGWSEVTAQKDRPYEVVRLEDKEGKKGLIGDMLSTMGKRQYDEENGGFITTTQEWDETAESQFMGKIKALQSDNRTMYSLLKQASGNKTSKKKDFTEEDEKLVEDFLRDQVKGGYGEETSTKIRSRTPEEMAKEQAANRALTRRGQDISNENADATRQLAADRLALDKWKAANPKKTGNPTQKELDSEKSKIYYDWALKLKNVKSDQEAQEVLDANGIDIQVNDSFWNWWDKWDIKAGEAIDVGNKTINVKETHDMAKQFARMVEGKDFKYDGTYAHDKIADGDSTTTPTTTGKVR